MTPCSEFELLISRQLDEALSPEEQEYLAQHLEVCPHCRTLVQELQTLHKTLSTRSLLPPVGLQAQIMAGIREESKPLAASPSRSMTKRMNRWLASAAALALVLSGVVLGGRFLLPSSEEYGLTPSGIVPSNDTLSLAPWAPMEGNAQDNATYADGADEWAEQENEDAKDSSAVQEPVAGSPSSSAPSGSSNLYGYSTPTPPPYSGEAAEVQENKGEATPNPINREVSIPEESYATPQENAESATGGNTDAEPFSAAADSEATQDEVPSAAPALTAEEAEGVLLHHLKNDLDPQPHASYQGISDDGAYHLFLYTDSSGAIWQYSVSLQGDMILSQPMAITP